MPAKNKFYATFYTKADYIRHFEAMMSEWLKTYFEPFRQKAYSEGLNVGTAYGIDMAIITLGRMGAIDISNGPNPEFFTEFMKTMQEAATDYGDLFDIDREENNDEDYWWSTEKMDKEIHDYTGDVYPKFKERYKR